MIAVQETNWISSEIIDMNSHIIFKRSKPSGYKEFGVAFKVSKQLKPHFIDFKHINERLCAIIIGAHFFNLWLINVHALTEIKEDAVKDEFYARLEALFDSLPDAYTINQINHG
ncbi:uncharacterized protein LOC119656974 [Hermetia illucens]|uniref:uncharacterized protein LOC119656974 n=1 Tax=Hermetia illucens TaxID=343691 RepID=UPI0018CC2753|nr:uncharacterized protein LOC119656974 [Hermetia illucens]